MKKFYTLLIALFAAIGLMQAQTIIYPDSLTWEADTDETYGDGYTTAVGDFTISYYKYVSTTTPVPVSQYNQLRLYKDAALLISGTKNIVKVVITGESSYTKTITVGTMKVDPDAKTLTWTGSMNPFVAQMTGGQTRVKNIKIFVEGENTDESEPESIWTSSAEAPLTVAGVLERAANFADRETSDKEVYVKGVIAKIDSISLHYGNAQYYIVDGADATDSLLIYRGLGLGGAKFTSQDALNVGDSVVLVGTVKKYKGTIELDQNNKIYSLNGQTEAPSTPIEPEPVVIEPVAELQNANFEDWTGETPDFWTAPVGTATLSLSTDAYSGIHAVSVLSKSSTNVRLASQALKLEAGAYTFSFFAKTETEGIKIRPGFVPVNEEGKADGNYSYADAATLSAEWAEYSYSFTLSKADTVSLVVMIPKNEAAASVLVDEAKLVANVIEPTDTTGTEQITHAGTLEDPFTPADANAKASQLAQGETSAESYYVKGIVKNVKFAFDADHGTATFYLAEDVAAADSFLVYSTYYLGNRAWAEGDSQINVGDEVIVVGQLTNYRGTYETASKKSYIYSLNGNAEDIDPVQYTEYTTIKDMQVAAADLGQNKVDVKYTFTNAVVTGIKGKNIYITDGERGLLLYGDNTKALALNSHFSGSITGKLQLFNGVTELGDADYSGITLSDVTEPATAVSATIADILNPNTKFQYESMLVYITDLTIQADSLGAIKGIDESDNEIVIYDQYGIGLKNATFDASATYAIKAVVGSFRGDVQLYPRAFADIEGLEEPTPEEPEKTYDLLEATQEAPYGVDYFIHLNAESTKDALQSDVWLTGYIVGYISGSSLNENTAYFTNEAPADTVVSVANILLAATPDVNDITKVVPIQLKNNTDARTNLNLKDNPDMLGKQVWLHGDVLKYMGVTGLKNVAEYSMEGGEPVIIDAILSVRKAEAQSSIFTLAGQRVAKAVKPGLYIMGGRKVVIK